MKNLWVSSDKTLTIDLDMVGGHRKVEGMYADTLAIYVAGTAVRTSGEDTASFLHAYHQHTSLLPYL